MNKTHTGLKRYLTAAVVFLLGIVIAVTVIGLPKLSAKAESADSFTEPNPVSLSMSNLQFADYSGSAPSAPTGWTGGGMAGSGDKAVKAGVVSLDASSYTEVTKDQDVYGLSDYPEYANGAIPQTPFGLGSLYDGTNRNVLMINTADATTAYAFASESFTLSAGGFYRISAFVKTGNFAEGTGAWIKLTGLDEELAFKNINTVRELKKDGNGLPELTESNMYGFRKYTFYVASPLVGDSSVQLSLQVGDRVENENYKPAKGYAFFDNIVAEQISANSFYHETEVYDGEKRDNYLIKDFSSNVNYLTDSGDVSYLYNDNAVAEGVDIGSFNNEFTGWERVSGIDGMKGGSALIYDTNGSFVADNEYGWTSKPISPVGNRDGDSNVLVLSSKERAAFGYTSPKFTIHRNTFYRLTYWVNTSNIEGSSGATAIIRGESGINDNDNKLRVASSLLSGDSTNVMRYGWKMYSFYIKGSALADYDVALELWLGQPDGESSGTVMFDEVKIEKLTPSEYNSNNSSGTIVVFDQTAPETGIGNGTFTEVGDYEEYKYPLLPASWTAIAPDTAETTGFSDSKVESSADSVLGIVSTDIDHYNANRGSYNNAANPKPNSGNVLMISSLKQTAVGYRSSSVTVSAGKAYRMTASLRTSDIGDNDYGASLVVKNGKNVVATIEGIKNSAGAFRTYTFYLEGGLSDQSVSLEIWLGLNDRKDNTSKLSAGTVFIDRVGFTELGESESYDEYAKKYDTLRTTGTKVIDAATYSFAKFDMSAYDYYGEGVVKTPYNWTLQSGEANDVVYGIFDYTTLGSDRTEIPEYFTNGDSVNNGVLYLHNRVATYSEIQSTHSLTLAENSYYKIDVSIKVDLPSTMVDDENVRGASIKLLSTDYSFTNIKSTANKVDETTDNEAFKTYTFYVKTSSATDVSLGLSLGESIYPNRACLGRVYVNNISIASINNVVYENAVDALDDDEEYIINADLSADDAEEPEEPEEPKEIAWWLIPSILFSVALVIALVGALVRKLLEKRSEKKTVQVTNTYDRKTTLHKLHNQKTEEGEETVDAEVTDDNYDEFDDTLAATPTKKAEESDQPAADDYDEFDDDKPENANESVESDQVTEEATAEKVEEAETAESEANADEQKAAEAEKVEEPKPETKKAEKSKAKNVEPKPAPVQSDAYTDEFED